MENISLKDLDSFLGIKAPTRQMDMSGMNDQQLEAVTTTDGPVLIIAGAGTGKTFTLINRMSYIITSGFARPEEILMLTFTNKAAREMVSRATEKIGDDCGRVKACTYHSFCSHILRIYADKAGILKDFIVIDPADAKDAINLIKSRAGYSKEKDFPKSDLIINIFSYATNTGESISNIMTAFYPSYSERIGDVKDIYEMYTNYKTNNGMLDYDDLLQYTNDLLRSNKEIAQKLSDMYKYIMVDEYQDSNILQLEFLKLLRGFDNKNLCVVGDDFQSIYSFRGANFKNIIDFPNQFDGCKVIILDKNYRSVQPVLDLANAITAGAKEKYDKHLFSDKVSNVKPIIVNTYDTYDQAKFVVSSIIKNHQNGVPYHDMAVLARAGYHTNEVEAVIAQVTASIKIPYKKFGGTKFMEKGFVKDIFAYLKILTNLDSELSWFRILQLYPNIGLVYAKKITDGIKTNGIEELNDPKYTKNKYGKYLPEIYKFYNYIKDLEFMEQIRYLVNDYYYEVIKDAIENKAITDSSKIVEMEELKDAIKQAQVLITMSEGYKTISSFVNDIMLEVPDDKDNNDYLTVSTVHSAKGLEFKDVYIVDCVNGCFPPVEKRPPTDSYLAVKRCEEEKEEERRIFYVAITRAKENLYLMYPGRMNVQGLYVQANLSIYLEENGIQYDYCDSMTVTKQ